MSRSARDQFAERLRTVLEQAGLSQAICDIIADPGHPDHAERVEWLGRPHDPAAFDKDAINASLARIRLG